MSGGKLLCVLGLASSLLAGYVTVGGVVGPWMADAVSLAAAHGPDGRTADQLARDLGVERQGDASPVLAVGRGVFSSYAARVQRAAGE